MEVSVGGDSPSDQLKPRSSARRKEILFVLALFFALRALVSVTSVIAITLVDPPTAERQQPTPYAPYWPAAISGTQRWDAVWFEGIAQNGYNPQDESAAFFPLFPLLIRVVVLATPLGEPGAALLVSNVSFLCALLMLHALTGREFATHVARRSVLLVACFPSSFFFFAPYSESLFLLCSLLAFWAIRRDRWGVGSVWSFAATLTRATGILLVPSFLVAALAERTPGWPRRAAASLSPLLALGAYGGYWYLSTGEPFRPWTTQQTWLRSPTLPFVTVFRATNAGVEGLIHPATQPLAAELLLTIALVAPFIIWWRLIPLPYRVYAVSSLLLVLSVPSPTRPLLSAPRLLVVVFPFFWAMAGALRGSMFRFTIGACLAGYVALTAAFVGHWFVF